MDKLQSINLFRVKQVRENIDPYMIKSLRINDPKVVDDIARNILDLHNEAVEKFGILSLTTKNEVAGIHIISTGILNASLVHPREVFQAAILNNANSIVLFHNHPSGDSTPSTEDVAITNRLIEAGDILGIKVLDHVIIGYDDYTSFKVKNLI